MDTCCENKSCELEQLRSRHSRALYLVLWVNAAMFLIEGVAGLLAHSTSLLADSLDMLGDAMVYGFSLFVLARSTRWQVGAAFTKAGFMLVFSFGVLTEAAYKIVHPVLPGAETMGMVGVLALAANAICFLVLYSHRGDNLNMSSTWLCSRNDLLTNVGVLFAAMGSYLLHSQWPDVIVGLSIAVLFVHSAWEILARSVRTWRTI